jgi:hypothetical protein
MAILFKAKKPHELHTTAIGSDITPEDLQDLMATREHKIAITSSGALEIAFDDGSAAYVWLDLVDEVPVLVEWIEDHADEVMDYWIAQGT